MPPLRPSAARLLAALAMLALALGAVACGSDDGDGGGSSGSGDGGRYDDGTGGAAGGDDSGASAEERARAAVEQLYDAMAEGDAEAVCDQLDARAREQIAEGGLSGEKTSTCVEGFERFFAAAEEAGGLDATLKAKVRSVDVDGQTAVARVNFGPGQNGDVPLVEVDGEWKLAAAGTTP